MGLFILAVLAVTAIACWVLSFNTDDPYVIDMQDDDDED